MKEATAPQIKSVSLTQIAEDLNNGLSKWNKDNIGFGSIEKKYNLLLNEAIELFGHPRVKKMETRIPTFIIVDDLPPEEEVKKVPEATVVLAVEPMETPKQVPIARVEVVTTIPRTKQVQAFI